MAFLQHRSRKWQRKNTFIEKENYRIKGSKVPKDMWRNGSQTLCHETVCVLHLHWSLWLRMRLVYHITFWHRKVISATITLSSCGAELRGGTSLVPFYCRLGIKSGSSAYSEKKKKEGRWTTVYIHCIKTIVNIYMCSKTWDLIFLLNILNFEKQTSGHFWTFLKLCSMHTS